MKGNFKIWCDTKKTLNEVLKKLESDGVMWCDGSKPTRFKPYGLSVGLFVDSHNELTFENELNYFNAHKFKEIKASEYLRKCKVGDRVKITEPGYAYGKCGVVKFFDGVDYAIEVDKYFGGHRCSNHCKPGHGWWVTEDDLEHINDKTEKIVIYRNDNEVVALDKSTGKKGVAKCSPDDEFNFMTGAKLAFDRLTGREEIKPHLESWMMIDDKHYGEIGKPTKLKDIVGRVLFVGDVVELFNFDNFPFGESSIVESEGKQYVMGILDNCSENGEITGGWKIIKKRSYTEVNDGEIIDKTIKYVGHRND